MGPTYLHYASKLLRFNFQLVTQVPYRGQKSVICLLNCSDVHGSREGVVARLSAIDMVVGMYWRLATNGSS